MTSHLQQEPINKEWTKLFQTEIKLHKYEQGDVSIVSEQKGAEMSYLIQFLFLFLLHVCHIQCFFFMVAYNKQHYFQKTSRLKMGLKSSTLLHIS